MTAADELRRVFRVVDDTVDDGFERWLRGVEPVDRVFYAASALGDFSLLWHLIGASRGVIDDRQIPAAMRLSVCLGIEAALVNGPIKAVFARSRPTSSRPRPLRLRQPRTSSFPSGHASAGFMAASLLSDRSATSWAWYALAVGVATSRLHVRIHHASDVIAGAALGLALGGIARRVWRLAE